MDWRSEFQFAIQQYVHDNEQVIRTAPPDARITVDIRAYKANPRADIDNMSKSVLDILEDLGFYENDCQVCDLRIQRLEGKEPWTEIIIRWNEE